MAVTAWPVILADSATGSDSAASGAGPSTALTGTAAVSTGTTVVLDAGTVLTGVATDGSHVLYFADATAGNRNFTAINGSSGSGGATPTVTVEQSLASTTKAWAIGGKRASIGSATSKKLFDNNSAAGDAMPGWAVEMQSGHTETIAATYDLRRAGDTTSGPIILRGTSGAGTLPVVTFSNNGNGFFVRGDYQQFRYFEVRNSNATKTASVAIGCAVMANSVGPYVEGVKISHSTNKFWIGMILSTGNNNTASAIVSCEVGYCASYGIGANASSGSSQFYRIINCFVHDCGGTAGINLSSNAWQGALIQGCVIYNNVGAGIILDNSRNNVDADTFLLGNTIDTNTTNGIQVNTASLNSVNLVILNNILSNNGNYGLNFNNASFTDALLAANAVVIKGNNTYLNTSGAYKSNTGTYTASNCPWASGDPGLNPQYTAASSGDFSIGTNLKAQGFPVGGTLHVGTSSGTYSYVDPGAAQRQEAGSGTTVTGQGYYGG